MKQTSSHVCPSVKRYSLARSKEIYTTILDIVVLDLRPIAVVNDCGFNHFNSMIYRYTVSKSNLEKQTS